MRNGGPLPYSTRRDKEGEQEGEETSLPSLGIGDHSCATTVQHSYHGQELRQRRKEGATQREGEGGRNGKPKWMCQYEDQARASSDERQGNRHEGMLGEITL